MRKTVLLFAVLAALFAGRLSAQSNAEPSLKVSLNPNCTLYSASLAANTRVDIATQVGGEPVCNIPLNATSIDVAVTVVATAAGSLKLWEADGTEPSAAVMSYESGTRSSFGSPRLCAPHFECFNGISVKSSSAVTLTLVVVAAYVPPAG